MDFEDSISSWIGKIREGFDTFCSEAKDFLPKKPVQNVQEQLTKAAENLKQFRCDLDIFSTFKLDSEHGKGPKSDETEENMYYSHAETKPSDEKKDVTESSEKIDLGCDNGCNFGVIDDQKDMLSERLGSTRFCPIPVEVEHGTFRYYPLSAGEPNNFESSPIIRDCIYLLVPPRNLKELELHHPPLMESFKFSDDDVHEHNPSTAEESSDSESKTQSSHYYHLLEEELRGEVIKDGFLSPLSGSVQSLQSMRFKETEKSSSSSDDEVTSSDDYTPRTINSTFDYYESQSGLSDTMTFLDSDSASILDMSECWSNFTPSPVVSDIAESNQEYEEIMQEKEWKRLDADFNDEDWEIV